MNSSAWRRWRTILLVGLAACCAAVAILAALLARRPDFYVVAVAAAGEGPGVEARARRMVTKASAVHASLTRPPDRREGDGGRWDAVIRADELNAWLAVDLPRSHADWLPRGLSAPRIAFFPRHAKVGIRVGAGPVSAVAWADAEIVLRDVNQVAIAIERACVGAIPLPRAAVMRELARRLGGLGVVTDLRWLDGRLVLLAHVAGDASSAADGVRIESLSLTAGELIVAGSTGPPARHPAGAAGGPPGR